MVEVRVGRPQFSAPFRRGLGVANRNESLRVTREFSLQISTFTSIHRPDRCPMEAFDLPGNQRLAGAEMINCRVRVGGSKLKHRRKISRRVIQLIAVAAILAGHTTLHHTPAYAQESIGEALAVIEATTVTGKAGTQNLVAGAKVYLGDRLVTDNSGTAQLLFSDGTKMVVGPKSELLLDAFVFRSAAAENQFAVRALTGVFRFITGDSPKHAYLIHTPTATMGVRGTSFDISVKPGETNVLVYTGSAAVCSNSIGCVIAAGAPEK